MKQFLSLLALACAISGAAFAATLSGTVKYQFTSTPVAGQVVYISDTGRSWTTSATTDAAGYYSVTIPTTVPTTMPAYQINVSTAACGRWEHAIAINSGINLVVNLNICVPSSSIYHLNGTVSLGGVANTDTSIVYLIRKAYNAALADTTLTVIDSIYTDISGRYAKTYSTMPTGTLLVKAALLPGHPSYSSYLPTYYTGSITWSGATAIGIAGLTSNPTNINLVGGTNPGGPAFVGGSVLLGANKSTAVGDPLSKRLLVLTKSTGEPIGYTYSDASGKFQFPSVPYGTYKIFGDAMGKKNPALTFTVSASQPRVANIIFEENDKKFEGRVGNVSVRGSVLDAVSIFPNPATTAVQVRGLDAIKGSKTLVLSAMTGAVISRQVVESGDAVISTANLPAGNYMLQVETAAGSSTFRIVK